MWCFVCPKKSISAVASLGWVCVAHPAASRHCGFGLSSLPGERIPPPPSAHSCGRPWAVPRGRGGAQGCAHRRCSHMLAAWMNDIGTRGVGSSLSGSGFLCGRQGTGPAPGAPDGPLPGRPQHPPSQFRAGVSQSIPDQSQLPWGAAQGRLSGHPRAGG